MFVVLSLTNTSNYNLSCPLLSLIYRTNLLTIFPSSFFSPAFEKPRSLKWQNDELWLKIGPPCLCREESRWPYSRLRKLWKRSGGVGGGEWGYFFTGTVSLILVDSKGFWENLCSFKHWLYLYRQLFLWSTSSLWYVKACCRTLF